MVRTRSQRAAMLLRLPTDVLFKIASHVVAPDLVVAAGKNLEARTALRKGTDAAERSRFGGAIGFTVREAEQILRTRYREYTDERWLASRAAAGRALCRDNLLRWADRDKDMDHPDFPEREEDLRWEFSEPEPGSTESVFYFGEVGAFFATGWCKMMIAYGADLDAQNAGGYTPLHYLAAYAPPIALASDLARLLIGAGEPHGQLRRRGRSKSRHDHAAGRQGRRRRRHLRRVRHREQEVPEHPVPGLQLV